jgi:hypothetical protein
MALSRSLEYYMTQWILRDVMQINGIICREYGKLFIVAALDAELPTNDVFKLTILLMHMVALNQILFRLHIHCIRTLIQNNVFDQKFLAK